MGVVEEAVEVAEHKAVTVATQRDGCRDAGYGLQADPRGVEHGVYLVGIFHLAVLTAHGVVHLRPQHGEVIEFLGGTVTDNLYALGRAEVRAHVATRHAAAGAIHVERLDEDVAGGVVLLIEHGGHGVPTHAVEENLYRL